MGDQLECARVIKRRGPVVGTYAGYQRHVKAGQEPCEPCREAMREYNRGTTKHAWNRRHYAANPELYRERNRLYKHGITPERYAEMLVAQGGACALCGSADPGGKPNASGVRQFAIDHDHACCPREKSCGECIRALLCAPCNNGLGCFRDNAEALRRAAEYIERHRR